MKCAVHTEVDATGFCRNCGKSLCTECTRDVRGILYCEGCIAALVSKPQPLPGAGNPTLAAVLGFIPGLGAVYNGEYMKALMHVLIFGSLITIIDRAGSGEPLFGLLMTAFYLYMPFEAYRTAKAKTFGQPPPDWLGLSTGDRPIGPIALVALGVIFLVNNLGLVNLSRILDFWPVLLILVGVWMLRKRTQPAEPPAAPPSGGAGL
jgi:hypothetical protein